MQSLTWTSSTRLGHLHSELDLDFSTRLGYFHAGFDLHIIFNAACLDFFNVAWTSSFRAAWTSSTRLGHLQSCRAWPGHHQRGLDIFMQSLSWTSSTQLGHLHAELDLEFFRAWLGHSELDLDIQSLTWTSSERGLDVFIQSLTWTFSERGCLLQHERNKALGVVHLSAPRNVRNNLYLFFLTRCSMATNDCPGRRG